MGYLIDMIDVGQGDAFFLTMDALGREVTILIDGGTAEAGSGVSEFIKRYARGHIDCVIGTHLDRDHIGGLADVVENCEIGEFYLNLPPNMQQSYWKLLSQRLLEGKKTGAAWEMLEKSLSTANSLCDELTKKGLVPKPLLAGQYWNLGDIVLKVLNPTQARLDEAWAEIDEDEKPSSAYISELYKKFGLKEAPETSAENNSSVVIELAYKGQPCALFTSDAGVDVLKEVTSGKSYDFLKVPHHGSKTGLDEELLQQLNPRTAYISVGDNNYGHPAIEILDLLRERGVKTFCSKKTTDCRRSCPAGGFGNLCHRNGKDWRPGWNSVDPSKCQNNC